MSLPLAVRLDGPDRTLQLTSRVRNLRFKNNAPGGFDGVELDLIRPIDATLLAQFTDLLVFDTETSEQVGGGRLIDQGREVSGTTMVWSLASVGEGRASLEDISAPLFYVDQSLEDWVMVRRSTRRVEGKVGTPPDAGDIDPGLLFEYADDKEIASGTDCIMRSRLPLVCSQLLGGFGYQVRAGTDSTNYVTEIRTYNELATSSALEDSLPWGGSTSARKVVRYGTDWTDARYMPAVRSVRTGATGRASDESWVRVVDPTLQARVYDQDGSWRTGSWYATESIKAHEVFIDLCRRRAPRLDIGNASIDAATFGIDQLSWSTSGVTGLEVMEEVLGIDSAFTWAVWAKQPNGLWETEFKQLPSAVRYEATVADGFAAPSPATEVYDGVWVLGNDRAGRAKSTFVSNSVEALSDVGISRTATIDLGDETWSAGIANRRGQQFLSQHAAAPNAGTLTIARPVFDTFTGRWVPPWRIRSGELIRYCGAYPSVDTLNRDGSDGVIVSRIVTSEFTADTGTADLQLDTFTLTERRAIARLRAARRRRRR